MTDIQFIEEETDEDLIYRRSWNNMVEIALHPVLFGWRVRAGYEFRSYYQLDYCCGDQQAEIELIYSTVLTILTNELNKQDLTLDKRTICTNVFSKFPKQNTKPMRNDPECMINLILLAGVEPDELIKVSFPDLTEKRQSYMNNVFNG